MKQLNTDVMTNLHILHNIVKRQLFEPTKMKKVIDCPKNSCLVVSLSLI